jgi:hypothetical protein
LTVAWAVESVAFLGGYLERQPKTPLGIQVLWHGWLKLHDFCQGWQLASRTEWEKPDQSTCCFLKSEIS